jgi:hypothetical protein
MAPVPAPAPPGRICRAPIRVTVRRAAGLLAGMGWTRLGSLFLRLPTRALTGQHVISSAGTGHSMTSSARSRIDCGIVRPSALAVFRLITSSNRVGCWAGVSPGAAPFSHSRLLPYQPGQITAERNKAQPLLKLGWATGACCGSKNKRRGMARIELADTVLIYPRREVRRRHS